MRNADFCVCSEFWQSPCGSPDCLVLLAGLENLAWRHGCSGVPFGSHVSSAGDGFLAVTLKNCRLCLLRDLGFSFEASYSSFEASYSRPLNSLQGRCLSLAVLIRLLKLGMLIPYVIFKI